MPMETKLGKCRGFILAACASGMLFGATCSSDQIRALTIGIQAATNALDDQDRNDDISFGDWLSDELKDL